MILQRVQVQESNKLNFKIKCHQKGAIIFYDSRLGLENKFFPNKTTQYERGLMIFKKRKNLPKRWVFKASKSQILCAVGISN